MSAADWLTTAAAALVWAWLIWTVFCRGGRGFVDREPPWDEWERRNRDELRDRRPW